MIKKFRFLLLCCFTASAFLLSSCSSENDSILTPDTDSGLTSEVDEQGYTILDLEAVASDLEARGYDVSEIMNRIKAETPQTRLLAGILINSKKITTTIINPADSSKMLTVSGVLLYPKYHALKSNLKFVVATPGTYWNNTGAPSVYFNNLFTWQNSLSNAISIAPYLLNAGENPILIVDYPGFGESFGKIAHPYLDRDVLAKSSVELIRQARKELKKDGVKLSREDISVTGYSQGAFVATSIVREIETNPKNGDLKVKLLSVGGLPANLNKILTRTIERNVADVAAFFPYGLWGYQRVRYPNIPVQKIIKEPYYTASLSDFWSAGVKGEYPSKLTDLYTEDFLKNYKTSDVYKELRRALNEADIHPWKNKARFFIFHGQGDTTVDFYQSKEFAQEHNAFGGKVTFTSLPLLGHTEGLIPYWLEATALIALY